MVDSQAVIARASPTGEFGGGPEQDEVVAGAAVIPRDKIVTGAAMVECDGRAVGEVVEGASDEAGAGVVDDREGGARSGREAEREINGVAAGDVAVGRDGDG